MKTKCYKQQKFKKKYTFLYIRMLCSSVKKVVVYTVLWPKKRKKTEIVTQDKLEFLSLPLMIKRNIFSHRLSSRCTAKNYRSSFVSEQYQNCPQTPTRELMCDFLLNICRRVIHFFTILHMLSQYIFKQVISIFSVI